MNNLLTLINMNKATLFKMTVNSQETVNVVTEIHTLVKKLRFNWEVDNDNIRYHFHSTINESKIIGLGQVYELTVENNSEHQLEIDCMCVQSALKKYDNFNELLTYKIQK